MKFFTSSKLTELLSFSLLCQASTMHFCLHGSPLVLRLQASSLHWGHEDIWVITAAESSFSSTILPLYAPRDMWPLMVPPNHRARRLTAPLVLWLISSGYMSLVSVIKGQSSPANRMSSPILPLYAPRDKWPLMVPPNHRARRLTAPGLFQVAICL